MRNTKPLFPLILSAILLCLLMAPPAETESGKGRPASAPQHAPDSCSLEAEKESLTPTPVSGPLAIMTLADAGIKSYSPPEGLAAHGTFEHLAHPTAARPGAVEPIASPPTGLWVCNQNNICIANFDNLATNSDVRDAYEQIKFSYEFAPTTPVTIKFDTCTPDNGCTQASSMPHSIAGGTANFIVDFPSPVSAFSFVIGSVDDPANSIIAQINYYNGSTQLGSFDVRSGGRRVLLPVFFGQTRLTRIKIVGIGDANGISYDDFSWSMILPGKPTNLRATSVTGQQAVLQWNAGPDATGYRVERSRSTSNGWEIIGTTNQTTFTDTSVQPGIPYFYRVTSNNLGGWSAPSDVLPVSTPLPAPTGLHVTYFPVPSYYDMIVLQWDLSPIVDQYVIRRSKSRTGPFEVAVRRDNSFISLFPQFEKVPEVDTTFYYVVSAVRNGIESPNSEPVEVKIKQDCGYVTMPRPPQHQVVAHFTWSMKVEVSDRDGVVLRDVKLRDRYITAMMSVPYVTVKVRKPDGTFDTLRVELTTDNPEPISYDKTRIRARLIGYNSNFTDEDSKGRELKGVSATYIVDHLFPGSVSCLKITQKYLFGPEEPGGCELSSTLPCARFYPKVEYDFDGKGRETLVSINIPQRIHNRVESTPASTVGLFRDCDTPPLVIPVPPLIPGMLPPPPIIVPTCAQEANPQTSLVFEKAEHPVKEERSDIIALQGRYQRSWDNVHQTNKDAVGKPFPADISPITARMFGLLGGCPECFHSHWRWGAEAAKLADFQNIVHGRPSFGGGNLIGFVGDNANQDLSLAVVRYRDTVDELHPLDYLSLVNREVLWKQEDAQITKQDTVLWYSTTGYNNHGTTFEYGAFANWDKGLIAGTIQPGTQTGAAAATAGSGTAAAATSAGDGPTNVSYQHGFKEGPTTFKTFDPNIVGPLPQGYTHFNNTGYEIETEVEASGEVIITFTLPSVASQTDFNKLRILQAEADPYDPEGGVWRDRTILAPDAQGPNFTDKTIRVRTTHLGLFVIASLSGQTYVPKSADIGVSAQQSTSMVQPNATLTYTVNVSNQGPDAAPQVGLANTLSPDVDFVSASPADANCKFDKGSVYCKLGSLSGGASKTVTIVAQPVEHSRNRFPAEGQPISFNAYASPFNDLDPNNNNNTASLSATAVRDPNGPPSARVTAPADSATFVGPVNVTITAEASDADGSISGVEFLGDGESIGAGEMTSAGQYRVTWNNVGFGVHSVRAVATDNGGRQEASDPIIFTVNGPATVNITSPRSGSFLTPGSTATITANVTHPSGSVSKVEFFANENSIGEIIASAGQQQFSLTWPDIPRGAYELSAVATDGNGVMSFSTRVNVFALEQTGIAITEPADATSLPPSTPINFKATISNTGVVPPRKVEFFVNGVFVGEGFPIEANQYSFTWFSAADGFYSVTAVATDAGGLQTASRPVNIAINTPGLIPGEYTWVNDSLPPGARPSNERDGWNWVESNPAPVLGAKAHQSLIADGTHLHSFDGATLTMPVNAGDKLFSYVFLHPGYMPQEVMLEWKDDAGWEHRAYWSNEAQSRIRSCAGTTPGCRRVGPLPLHSRWVRLEVPAELVGLDGKLVNGMSFAVYGGRATWDRSGKSDHAFVPPTAQDTVWFDDAMPAGAAAGSVHDDWFWVPQGSRGCAVSTPAPYSGNSAHQTFWACAGDNDPYRAHYFGGATAKMEVNPGDVLYAYAYMDTLNKPDQLVLRWHDGEKWRGAYWGASYTLVGEPGTETMRYMGELPAAGQWVRLEVPAGYVGLEGKLVNGMYFGMHRRDKHGLVTWDQAGKSTRPPAGGAAALYVTTPFFRYFSNNLGYFYHPTDRYNSELQPGIRWYAPTAQAAGTIPLYRYKHSVTGQYLYHVLAPNADNAYPVSPTWKLDWAEFDKGIAFYVYPKEDPPPPGGVELHQYFKDGKYFYTIHKGETVTAGMSYEGAVGYVFETRPVISPVDNPIDDQRFFVRQHYIDFLNREPDLDGLDFWTHEIMQCTEQDKRQPNETVESCFERKRVDVSGAFFLSIEFQETGFLAYRLYNASLNRPPEGLPRFDEFMRDSAEISQGLVVGADGWQQLLENNKVAFLNQFVARTEFTNLYPESLTPEQYVDKLYAQARLTPTPEERQAAVNEFNAGGTSQEARARVLRRVAESPALKQRETNRAFVLMQYFGYLRRNPDDPPDRNLDGYLFWLKKLNDFNGDFRAAEMVKAFITSIEYRARFGQPVTSKSVSNIGAGASTVKAGAITVNFAGAASGGEVQSAPVYPGSLAPGPHGYRFYPNLAWQLTTTSTAAPSTVRVNLEGVFNDPAEFALLRLLQLENGVWVDRTILAPDAPAPDFATRTINARVTSLAPIAVARLGDGDSSGLAISITAPVGNQTFTALTDLSLSAAVSGQAGGIAKVEFFVDGELIGEDTAAPFDLTWLNPSAGGHALTARVTEVGGRSATSAAVNVLINDRPAVYIASPAQNSALDYPASVVVNAYANDADGIKQVEFFQGTTSLGVDASAPYSVNWSGAPVGTYRLTAVATDNKNATMTSPAVNVTIRNPPPTLQTVSPWTVEVGSGAFTVTVNGSNFMPGAVVTFNGQSRATTFVSSSRVTAQIQASDVATAGQFPVAVVNPLPAGSVSNSYSFPVNVPPSVTLTSPTNGQIYITPVKVTFTASVTDDTDGAAVAYYSGNSVIASSGSAPTYRFDWSGNAPPGQYTIKAVVTDRHGSVRSSAPVTITVKDPAPVLTEDFNDNRLDFTKWRYSNADSQSFVLEQNQRLEIPLRPNTTGYYGIQTLGTHDLRGKTMSVELVQPTNQGGWTETYYQLKRDEGNYYHMSVGAGSFVLDAWTGGVRDRTVLPYDTSVGRFWRYRHDVASNTMNFETSPDGNAWTTHKTVAAGFPLDSMYAVMLAGAWGTGNSTPGAAIFDNFILKSTGLNQPPSVTLMKPAPNATFGLGAPINLSANASDSDGAIQRVEFYEGPNKLGEDTTEPYTFQWNNARPGNYFITAKAVDSAGSVVTSGGASIAVSNTPAVEALLVVANPAALDACDSVIKSRLENLGFTVTVKGVSVLTSDANNKSLVFVSETVTNADINSKFRDVTVPVISTEAAIFDDMGMTGLTNGGDYGFASGQTQINILTPSHPLAAGTTGVVTVSTQASIAGWGKPAASAAQVASLSYDGTAKAIFAYESGAVMVNGQQAPARRVGLFLGRDALTSLTESGGAIFDAAVRWATTTPPTVQYPYNNTPAAIPGTVQVELFDEGGDGTAYHDLTPGNDASNTYRYPTNVDAWDGGVGYVQAGEWLEYTVNISTTGSYKADARAAAPTSGGAFHIEFDGVDKTGPLFVPNTGGWSTYQTISKDNVQLEAGRHVMRIVMDANGTNGFVANFDSVSFAPSNGASDLVAYWKLDEGSGTAISDAVGNTGTLIGPTWFAGRVGTGALNFDGVDDRVIMNATPALAAVSNNFTLSFWAYPRSSHEIDAEGSILGGAAGQRYAFEPAHGVGQDAGAGISIGTNGVSVYEHADNYMPAQLVYQAPLTGWTHVTLVYENKQPRLYINGALVRTGPVSQRANIILNPQAIGGMVYGYYDGLLDDIRIYNRALNSSEVSTAATSGAGNATTEFSVAQNPNGAWSYGYRTTAGAPFKLYPTWSGSGNSGTWYDASITEMYNTPQVSHSQGSTFVHMHPGAQGQQTILRWTAPAAAVVNIGGRFENMNNATTDVHVVHNSTSALFDGAINGQGSVAPFSIRKAVAAGDTLDFVVGWGSNGNYAYDSTGLALNLTAEAVRNQAMFVSQSAPASADVGSKGAASVTFMNTGTTTWSSAGNYNLGSQSPQDNVTWGMARVALPGPVPPGGQVTFNFNATAPSTPGTYGFRWRMVQDYVEWFGDYSTPANIVVSQPLGILPVGDWSFDDGSGLNAADATPNGNTGTLRNGVAWAPGRFGAGLNFDGIDDNVKVGPRPGLTMSNTMTMAAWVYPTGGSNLGIIINKEAEYEVARFPDGTIQWAFANTSPGWNFINTGYVPPLNQWTHIAVTYDRGTVKTYANGQLVHTYLGVGAIGDMDSNQNDLRIGGRQCCAQYFQGRLDEVRVYNQTLDATGINQLWQGLAPRNLAVGRAATQSSDAAGGVASRAVDGNIDGNWANSSVTQTNADNQAWWQVDLSAVQSIAGVRIWNRTDCCPDRLSNFYVLVSDVPFTSSDLTTSLSQPGVSVYLVSGQPWSPATVMVNRTGRYVRVQLKGTNYLSLAEVEVFGVPGMVASGVVQAEDFNNGTEGVAYHDTDVGNNGGAYRQTDVDVASGCGTGYCVGWTMAGEWLDYSINVLQQGVYNVEASVARLGGTGSFHVEIDGVNVTGSMMVPDTGGWNTWQTIVKPGIQLTSGRHTMRVVMESPAVCNFDYFRLVAAQ